MGNFIGENEEKRGKMGKRRIEKGDRGKVWDLGIRIRHRGKGIEIRGEMGEMGRFEVWNWGKWIEMGENLDRNWGKFGFERLVGHRGYPSLAIF